MNELTYKEVWNTLTQIDVSDYTDKKGNFTYLSWGVAWLELMKVYPQAQYEFLPETINDNGTVMVHCIVRIGNLERYMWLPPMDFNNNSIKNPTTRQISDARMRCLVKCIAMFGLGHHIFSMKDSSVYGEDLPDKQKDKSEMGVISNKYSLVSVEGEDLGIYVGEVELVKELKTHLGVAKKDIQEEHKDFFRMNKETIRTALENAQGQEHTVLNKVVAHYHDVWVEDIVGVSSESKT